MFTDAPRNTLIRMAGVLGETGNGRSTVYRLINDGLFPEPVKLGARAAAWPAAEVAAINAARIAGKTDDEIRALVKTLVAARRNLAVL